MSSKRDKNNRRKVVRRKKRELEAARVAHRQPPRPIGIMWVCTDPACTTADEEGIHHLGRPTSETPPQNENDPGREPRAVQRLIRMHDGRRSDANGTEN